MGRGVALVSMAAVIVLGAKRMNDICLLAHHEPVFGAPTSDTTVRRTLDWPPRPPLDKITPGAGQGRARVWWLIAAPPAGFPWLVVAGKILKGWLVIDLDATLITAEDDTGLGLFVPMANLERRLGRRGWAYGL